MPPTLQLSAKAVATAQTQRIDRLEKLVIAQEKRIAALEAKK
jgi:hypothetical protein